MTAQEILNALYYGRLIGKQEDLDEAYGLPKVTHAGFET
jgi:hypothetical protein